MEEFLDPIADHSESYVYQLHTVIVRSGEDQNEHYYAFIKPSQRTHWLKFDGDLVVPASEKQVFDENYGSESLFYWEHDGKNLREKNTGYTSAYALVYIRKSRSDEILKPLTADDRPKPLSRYQPEF
jgi:ubiquitin carboxyl-terminal hydrolase 7